MEHEKNGSELQQVTGEKAAGTGSDQGSGKNERLAEELSAVGAHKP
jgi:hypothetical protein